jgi:hypothetical protein
MPGPVRIAVEMVTHAGMPDAVQLQPVPVLTDIALLRPEADAERLVGVKV